MFAKLFSIVAILAVSLAVCSVCRGEDPAKTKAQARAQAALKLREVERDRQAYDAAVKAGKQVVVCVGLKCGHLSGDWQTFERDHFPGLGSVGKGIVVSRGGYWLATLPVDATKEEIEQAFRASGVGVVRFHMPQTSAAASQPMDCPTGN